MINTIICPTDFSTAAQNGTQYAAKLAQLTGARLYFVHVIELTPLEATVTALSGSSSRVSKIAGEETAKLEQLCTEVNRMFGISADFEVNATAAPFNTVFAGAYRQNSLLVTGTNGEDVFMQRLFGSSSYRMITDYDGPVLIIPETVTYGTPKKMVYAWGEHLDLHFSLGVLKDFVDMFNPEVICLHVAEPRSLPDAKVYEDLRSSIETNFTDTRRFRYERVDSERVTKTLQEYMRSAEADILVINHRHVRGITTPLKQLVAQSDYPLLVIPA